MNTRLSQFLLRLPLLLLLFIRDNSNSGTLSFDVKKTGVYFVVAIS